LERRVNLIKSCLRLKITRSQNGKINLTLQKAPSLKRQLKSIQKAAQGTFYALFADASSSLDIFWRVI
jgi:hypothetical protein